ncbi:hypothetical protein ACGFIG_14825 [Micromonospora sp. NPDC049048]|uniref:hypothetical protein n=1 Tax=Micromonospora sp. NPDC049048 TaxID=3364263 RepID=UPI003723B909
MGDGDLLQAELAGLRTFADTAAGTGAAFTDDARRQLGGIADTTALLGQPAGFREMRWFARVADTDLDALRAFAEEFTDGLASTARGADLAHRWYTRMEGRSTQQLDRIEDALATGDLPGPSYDDGTSAPAGPVTGPVAYGYDLPGVQRTNWAALDADQIATLVLGVRPEVADALATQWQVIAESIGAAGVTLKAQADPLHWYGQGGREFRRNVNLTVASARAWRDSAANRAADYDDARRVILDAQRELRAIVSQREGQLGNLRLDLAVAISPLGQAGVQAQIAGAERAATEAARAVATRLSTTLAAIVDGWRPAAPYRGLLGLAPGAAGAPLVDGPATLMSPAAGPALPPGFGPDPGPTEAGPQPGPQPGPGPAGSAGPGSVPGGQPPGMLPPGAFTGPGTPGQTVLPPALRAPRVPPMPSGLPAGTTPGGLLGPGGVLRPGLSGVGPGGIGGPGSGRGVPALGRSPDRNPPVHHLAPDSPDVREPTLGARTPQLPTARENEAFMPMMPGLLGRPVPEPAGPQRPSAYRNRTATSAEGNLSGRAASAQTSVASRPDDRPGVLRSRPSRREDAKAAPPALPAPTVPALARVVEDSRPANPAPQEGGTHG